jgi:hypothetical protein
MNTHRLFIYQFTELTKRPEYLNAVRRAWEEGFDCFQFTCKIKKRSFEERVALDHKIHDESDAAEMAIDMWYKFENTVKMILKA